MSKTMEDIRSSTIGIADEIVGKRHAAHLKHGDNSIETVDALETGRWLAIFGEEVGGVCHELTYDANTTVGEQLDGVRRELLDAASVAIAWIAAIDETLASEPFQPDFGKDN